MITQFHVRVGTMRETNCAHRYTLYLVGDAQRQPPSIRERVKVLILATHLTVEEAEQRKAFLLAVLYPAA